MAKKTSGTNKQTPRTKVNHQYQKMPKTYILLNEIQDDPLYKSNVVRRDAQARKIIGAQGSPVGPGKLVAGNIYLMEYFEPKLKEHLEYYDAMPCSMIFGKFKTKKGEPRILAFSLHYFPPRVRFRVMNKVMEIYKEIYRGQWSDGLDKDLSFLQYQQLLYLLQKSKLQFAVHEYIPKLIGECILVPPSLWHIAAFTEGRFKKRTRQMILNYWKQYKP